MCLVQQTVGLDEVQLDKSAIGGEKINKAKLCFQRWLQTVHWWRVAECVELRIIATMAEQVRKCNLVNSTEELEVDQNFSILMK